MTTHIPAPAEPERPVPAVGGVVAGADDERFCDLPTGIRLCYRIDGPGEAGGPDSAVPVLLIAGLSLDLTSWPSSLVAGLVASGRQVIRFDNREVGRTTFRAAPPPPPGRARLVLARPRPDAYDLTAMAEDAVGLLDHLGVARAHVVGMSMGGMIAQSLAAAHGARVATLTSIFSNTGTPGVGQPARSTLRLMAKRPPRDRAEYVARHLALLAHIGSTTFPPDAAAEADWAAGSWDRGPGPRGHEGIARQIGAIQASGDRTASLAAVTAPTLVIHGDADLMVHPSGGRATAAAIAGARHVEIPGLRHHLAPGVVDQLVELVTGHLGSGERAPAGPSHGAGRVPG
ncbi:putative hydrolase or acyltransferase of alpha/beta superfamily [Frankia sp. EI5c]|uniref:alpha/beta fold hydrolase n=1 Tax=Frankia sp. EI5c TaxID=683316 RepID=UPI0007C34DFD|nr:alpha/beta hydrolase [Frankia sp. EI5c]OAA18383.1 putative hydrolase or acyltransferase of alpha/beta superfamily [Frankia sp. EI5c]